MEFNKPAIFQNLYLNGVRFKNPIYICDKFQLFNVHHQGIGNLMCQIIPLKNSVQYFYAGFLREQNTIETRYFDTDTFSRPIFIYRDQNYEYLLFAKFITLGQIIAKRIVDDAPVQKEREKQITEFTVSHPRNPAQSEYKELLASDICDLYEKQTGRSIFSKLNGYECNMLVRNYCIYAQSHRRYFQLQSFDVHRYCFKVNGGKNQTICSDMNIYDWTSAVGGTDYLFQRKMILLNFASQLFRILSPTFHFQLDGQNILKNQTQEMIVDKIKKNLGKRNGGFLGKVFDYKFPWLTNKIAFFITKILSSKTINSRPYLNTKVWREFFQDASIKEEFHQCKGIRDALFILMRCGCTNQSKNGQYDSYVKLKILPDVITPNQDPILTDKLNNEMFEEDVICTLEDKCETDFIDFQKTMKKSDKRPEVWERLG